MRAPLLAPRPVLALITILGSGVAVSPLVAQKYVAPTNETISTRIEEGYGSRPSQVIWVYNGSTVSIDVFSVTLRSCENVRQDCAPRPLRLHLRPGHSEVLDRVEPQDPEKGFSFRYTFGWRADSAEMAALHVLAAGGDRAAQQMTAPAAQPAMATAAQLMAPQPAAAQPAAMASAPLDPRDVILGQEELVKLGPQITSIRVQPDSIVIHVGQSFLMHQVRVFAYDLQGNMLGRVGTYRGKGINGILAAHGDTATAQRTGRTRLEFQLAPPAAPLTAMLPVIVIPRDTLR
jgi:hypothetical protein